MSRRKVKKPLSERQISAQESHIPKIAARAFNNAFNLAIESGATVLVAEDGHLLAVSKTKKVVLRKLENYGSLKPGTPLKINKSRFNKVSGAL